MNLVTGPTSNTQTVKLKIWFPMIATSQQLISTYLASSFQDELEGSVFWQMHWAFVSVGILLRHCWWIAFHIRQSTHQQETRYEGNQSLASWTDWRSWGTDLAFGLLELYSPMSAFQCVRRWPCSKLECVLLAIQEWFCCEAVVYVGKGQGMIFNKSELRHVQTIEWVGGSSDVSWLCSPCKLF